jgi:predicted unusual protein kinase regulating ubiquinone biosynthesis (AarF/ABC1/UbiB family)
MLRSSSICASFLYKYLTSDSDCKDENGIKLDKNVQKLQCMAETFATYGGVFSKLSQILSLNDQNNNVFSDCKPFSKEKTIEYFKNFIECIDVELQSVNFDVYKSGSIGQVHKAIYNGRDIVFKVQYVGLAEQTLTDLNMLDKITSYVYYFADIHEAMIDIKKMMYQELDYKIEASNQNRMYEIYKDNDFIEIPKIIRELSTDTILSMYFVEGKCLPDFICNSTQEERNKFGMCLVKFVFENIYKHSILYSDLHYGNFLVKDDSTLCVLDFGCIHYIDNILLNNLRELYISIRSGDKDKFYHTVETMGIITKDISEASRKYVYDYFCIQYEPWTSEEFEFTQEWLEMACGKETELMKEWTLPPNMVYFNKIPYGCYHIFTKLRLKGNFGELFDQMMEEKSYS